MYRAGGVKSRFLPGFQLVNPYSAQDLAIFIVCVNHLTPYVEPAILAHGFVLEEGRTMDKEIYYSDNEPIEKEPVEQADTEFSDFFFELLAEQRY